MKWPFRFKVWQGSLKNRLLVSFLLLPLVPLGAASLVAYRTITDGAHEAAIREMTALAHSAAISPGTRKCRNGKQKFSRLFR
jgi:hypothetical protein